MKVYELTTQMDDTVLPLRQSASHDEQSRQLNAVFLQVYQDLFNEKINNILNYGSPNLLPKSTLIEQFAKQKGLVLYNNNANVQALRVLYEAWTGLSTKRGLGFIEFILKTLWGSSGYYINHIYHPIDTISQYPTQASYLYQEGMMTTSRVAIGVYDTNSFAELQKLAPTLQQIAPVNIVIEVVAAIDLGELNMPLNITMSVGR